MGFPRRAGVGHAGPEGQGTGRASGSVRQGVDKGRGTEEEEATMKGFAWPCEHLNTTTEFELELALSHRHDTGTVLSLSLLMCNHQVFCFPNKETPVQVNDAHG